MNSEAERARNARKRAKLRAKKRGDQPSLRRVSVTIRVWPTDFDLEKAPYTCDNSYHYYWDEQHGEMLQAECDHSKCFECMKDMYEEYKSANTVTHKSGERLITRHELQIQDLTWLEVFCVAVNEDIRLRSTPSHPAHAHIRVEVFQNGQRREEEWQVEVGEVEAADLAAEMGC